MEIKLLKVAGIEEAIKAMRNPYDSWDKSDSRESEYGDWEIGEKDLELSLKLSSAGPVHGKHLRLIDAWADVTASFVFWKQMDTYRMGVDKVSCSTMHTLTKREFSRDMFEDYDPLTIEKLNTFRQHYLDAVAANEKDDASFWENKLIYSLPMSFLQKRTYKFSYAALAAMYEQRKNHKLEEWHTFCEWIKGLPYSFLIVGKETEVPDP